VDLEEIKESLLDLAEEIDDLSDEEFAELEAWLSEEED
jgi:hypothetical protein